MASRRLVVVETPESRVLPWNPFSVHEGLFISSVAMTGRDLRVQLERPNAPVALLLRNVALVSSWTPNSLVGGRIASIDSYRSGSGRISVELGDGVVHCTGTSLEWA